MNTKIKLSYTITNHFRDVDNYPDSKIIDNSSVIGDTIEECFNELFEELKESGKLEYIIETEAKNLSSYDDCWQLTINSITTIIIDDDKDYDFYDFREYPQFKEFIENRKIEIEKEKLIRQKSAEDYKNKKEKETLEYLLKKYPQGV